MMARRPAESEGGGQAAFHARRSGQRHLGGGERRAPGAGHDGRAGIEAVVADLGADLLRHDLAQPPSRPGIGHRLALAVGLPPLVPGALEEAQEIGAVDARDRFAGLALGGDDLAQLHLPQALDDVIGPPRHLEDRHHAALDELGRGVMQVVCVGIDGEHESPRMASRFA
jgi:hypothetical protein